MKIQDTKAMKLVAFKTIKVGEVFRRKDESLWLALAVAGAASAAAGAGAVNLSSGTWAWFDLHEKVSRVNGTFIVD